MLESWFGTKVLTDGDQIVIHQSIDSSVFEQSPSILGSWDIALAVQCCTGGKAKSQ